MVTGKVDVRGLAFELPEDFDNGDLSDAEFEDADELEIEIDEDFEEISDAD